MHILYTAAWTLMLTHVPNVHMLTAGLRHEALTVLLSLYNIPGRQFNLDNLHLLHLLHFNTETACVCVRC